MQTVFIPTNYTFTFDDTYFVQVAYAGAFLGGSHRMVACFADLADAISFADAQVKRDDITASYVFTRAAQVHSAYSPRD